MLEYYKLYECQVMAISGPVDKSAVRAWVTAVLGEFWLLFPPPFLPGEDSWRNPIIA